ncbi:iron ABC transporter permease [Brevibacterium samyangense]|uniref:Iron chelate uptake ABC transporter family permease subunit n=1 Tax=Brevibacterium samyangense TaxID=366888 RepID=A0ABP5F343_9MICO
MSLDRLPSTTGAGPGAGTGPAGAAPAPGTGPAALPARGARRFAGPLTLATLVLALAVVGVLGLFAGSKDTGFGEVLAVLTGGGDDYIRQVVDARIPRTVVGAVVGAALAASGTLIQGLTRNPLGEPGLLGIGAGASAAMVTASALAGSGAVAAGTTTVWVALPGAVCAVLVVYLLGRQSRSASVVPLVLAGSVVTAVLTAYVNAMILLRPDVFDSYRFWMVGSLAGVEYAGLLAALPAFVLGAVVACLLVRPLEVLSLGDAAASGLGVRVMPVRAAGLAAATLLAAAAIAVAGPIAFVGLAVPHILRAVLGTEYRWLLPASFLGGALVLVGADVLGRVLVRPQELMVGIVTAFLGAPFLLAAVRRGAVEK